MTSTAGSEIYSPSSFRRRRHHDRMAIRPMIATDWPEVAAIYAAGIATGNATFETETPDWAHWDAAQRDDRSTCLCCAGRLGSVAVERFSASVLSAATVSSLDISRQAVIERHVLQLDLGLLHRRGVYYVMYMATRTQIYLTDEQRARLRERARAAGVPMSQLIRDAIDSMLTEEDDLEATFGSSPDIGLRVPPRSEWVQRG
jgi:hypothetical protein